MTATIPLDTPLGRVLQARKTLYEGGYLDDLMQKSQEADDKRDALGGPVWSAAANAAFQTFTGHLKEYERTCDVLRGKLKPSPRDEKEARDEAMKGEKSRYVWR